MSLFFFQRFSLLSCTNEFDESVKVRFTLTWRMQGLRIILRYFYSHQLIGIFPESFFMNARPEAEKPISTFNFPFLFFGLGRVFC